MPLTPEERSTRAHNAAKARWDKEDSVTKSLEMQRVASFRFKGRTREEVSEYMRALRAKREEKKLSSIAS